MDLIEFEREYFNFCSEIGLRPSEVVVSSGGALLMLGLRDSTNDLDLSIPSDTYEFQRYLLGPDKERVTGHGTFLDYNEKVNLQKLPMGVAIQVVNGVRVYSLDDLIRQKEALIQSLDRSPLKVKQDHVDIERLKEKRRDMAKLLLQH